MVDFKHYKEREKKIHESLYENLTLLAAFYPPRDEFKKILTKDMFVKNNKAAFIEVIYFLLNTLNPQLTKEKLQNWPPFEVKMESKFRAEVIAYVNSLNLMYETANIPSCQTSTLISPGGYRFAQFMFKISQLVVYVHLKKTHNNLLCPLKPLKNFNSDNQLKKVTKIIEKESNDLLEEFNKNYTESVDKSREITQKIENLNQEIKKSKQTIEKAQAEFNQQYPSYPSLKILEEKLIELKKQINKLNGLDDLFHTLEKMLKYLNGSTMTLEHNEVNFNVPEDVTHIVTNKNELNLCEFFEALRVVLEKNSLKLRSPSETCMQQTKEAIEKHSVRNQASMKQLEAFHENICGILDYIKDITKNE